MEDLFERETTVLRRAKTFLNDMTDTDTNFYDEYINLTIEYEQLLRQAKLVIRCADLTTTGLNLDKLDLMDKVNIDELTGIYNRRFMEENLRRYLKLLCRTRGHLSILMLDLDFFKNYNDTYGHTAGDICLKKVAETLQDSINRTEDFVARYGGEEFLIVLSGASKEGAMLVAQTILKNISDLQIPHKNSAVADYVTISIGITSADALQVHEPEDFITKADIALYRSKETGRNKITYVEFEEEEND